jgi:hypothetical protein
MKSFKWLTELETYEMSYSCSQEVAENLLANIEVTKSVSGVSPLCINHIGRMRLLPGIAPAESVAAVRRRFPRCVTWIQRSWRAVVTRGRPDLGRSVTSFRSLVFSAVLKWCFGDTESVLQPRLDSFRPATFRWPDDGQLRTNAAWLFE